MSPTHGVYGTDHRRMYMGEEPTQVHPDAKRAKRCTCDHPQTYVDEDGERRCLCGRRV